MVLPFVTAALIIAFIIGGTLNTAYWRDAVTKEYEKEIALSRDETTEEIMNSDLPDEDKLQLLMKYFGVSAPGFDFGELSKYIPVVVGGYIAASMLGGRK